MSWSTLISPWSVAISSFLNPSNESENAALTSVSDMDGKNMKRSASEPAYHFNVEAWNSVLIHLKTIEEARLAEKELLSSIDRLHEKITKHPSVWGLKAGKKCRKLYSQTLEKAKEQVRIIEETSALLNKLLDEASQPSEDLRKKKRKVESLSEATPSSSIPSASIPSSATSIAPGRQVAAKILKEGTPVWILAVVVKHHPDKDKFEVEDAETDVESPDYKRIYRFNSENIVALPLENDVPTKHNPGSWVLALYPDTSCFYKARIVDVVDNHKSYLVRFEEDDNQKRMILAKNIVNDPRHANVIKE